jgi:hypothetical protein
MKLFLLKVFTICLRRVDREFYAGIFLELTNPLDNSILSAADFTTD